MRAKTKYANPDDVRTWARNLDAFMLQCREMGHSWSPYNVLWNKQSGMYDRQLKCVRCETLRIQTISSSGEIVTSHYGYPDGYLANLGRIVGASRDVMRLESVLRSVNDQAQKPRSRRRRH